MITFDYVQDFTLLKLTASQYKLSGINNDILAEEVLTHINDRYSDDPNNNLSEDSKITIANGTEVQKLVDIVNLLASKKGLITDHAWGQIHRPLESTNTHHHGISPYAWVYYVKVPQGSGDLTFWFFDKFKNSIEPKESHLVLFPGWMNHSVSKNRGSEIRISIAGNLKDISDP